MGGAISTCFGVTGEWWRGTSLAQRREKRRVERKRIQVYTKAVAQQTAMQTEIDVCIEQQRVIDVQLAAHAARSSHAPTTTEFHAVRELFRRKRTTAARLKRATAKHEKASQAVRASEAEADGVGVGDDGLDDDVAALTHARLKMAGRKSDVAMTKDAARFALAQEIKEKRAAGAAAGGGIGQAELNAVLAAGDESDGGGVQLDENAEAEAFFEMRGERVALEMVTVDLGGGGSVKPVEKKKKDGDIYASLPSDLR
jgi:hypothetical protein